MKRLAITALGLLLVACGKPATDTHHADQQGATASRDQAYQVKPAVKLSTDASGLAQKTMAYLQQAEPLLDGFSMATDKVADKEVLEKQVFTPVRDLLLHWRTDVKQTDSVVGDQYTICRGALMSFDAWARDLLEHPAGAAEKKQVYLNQKQLCEKVLAQGQPSGQS